LQTGKETSENDLGHKNAEAASGGSAAGNMIETHEHKGDLKEYS